MNTEEMMSDISRVNCEGLNDKNVVGSTDVKALYPSLDIPFTIEVVGDVFYNSNVNIAGVDNEELGLYISLNRSVDEINALSFGLSFLITSNVFFKFSTGDNFLDLYRFIKSQAEKKIVSCIFLKFFSFNQINSFDNEQSLIQIIIF